MGSFHILPKSPLEILFFTDYNYNKENKKTLFTLTNTFSV